MGDDMTVKRPLYGPVAVRMLELQPGMVSRICESFKVTSSGVVGIGPCRVGAGPGGGRPGAATTRRWSSRSSGKVELQHKTKTQERHDDRQHDDTSARPDPGQHGWR